MSLSRCLGDGCMPACVGMGTSARLRVQGGGNVHVGGELEQFGAQGVVLQAEDLQLPAGGAADGSLAYS